MLKFSGSSCVHQVQGKVSWEGDLVIHPVQRRRFGEVERGEINYPNATLEVLPSYFVAGSQTKKGRRAGDGVW